jgi:hypothetical protein
MHERLITSSPNEWEESTDSSDGPAKFVVPAQLRKYCSPDPRIYIDPNLD